MNWQALPGLEDLSSGLATVPLRGLTGERLRERSNTKSCDPTDMSPSTGSPSMISIFSPVLCASCRGALRRHGDVNCSLIPCGKRLESEVPAVCRPPFLFYLSLDVLVSVLDRCDEPPEPHPLITLNHSPPTSWHVLQWNRSQKTVNQQSRRKYVILPQPLAQRPVEQSLPATMTAWSVLVVLGVLANEVRARPTAALPSSGLVLEAVHHEVDKASRMGQQVSELEAQLTSMKRMAEVQAAETKAALVSLKEKLVFAEEKEAETEGELEVSEEHVKDLEKQLAEEASRRKALEAQTSGSALSFLQLDVEDDLAATQKELAFPAILSGIKAGFGVHA
eukprot:s644_g9.t1